MTWLFIPSASVPDSPDSTSESRSPVRELTQWCSWKGKHGLPRGWQKRLKRGSLPLLSSTLTLPLSTVSRGVEAWISSLRDFRALQKALSSYLPKATDPYRIFELEISFSHTRDGGDVLLRQCVEAALLSGKSRLRVYQESLPQMSIRSSQGEDCREGGIPSSERGGPLSMPTRHGVLPPTSTDPPTSARSFRRLNLAPIYQSSSGGWSADISRTAGGSSGAETERDLHRESSSAAVSMNAKSCESESQRPDSTPQSHSNEPLSDSSSEANGSTISLSGSGSTPTGSEFHVLPLSWTGSDLGHSLTDISVETVVAQNPLRQGRRSDGRSQPSARPSLSVWLLWPNELSGSLPVSRRLRFSLELRLRGAKSDSERSTNFAFQTETVLASLREITDGSWSDPTRLPDMALFTTSPSRTMSHTSQTERSSITASRSPSPADDRESRTNATSGRTSSESLGKCSPPWSSSRTSQTSLPGFDLSEKNYQEWVTGLREEYSRRLKSARLTNGKDSSAWPTEASAWATPATRDHKGRDLRSRHGGASLSHQAETGQMTHSRPDQATPGGQTSLLDGPNSHQQWPTPNPPNGGRRMRPEYAESRGQTPTGKRQVYLETKVEQVTGKPKLNPLFVEWLMGWPPNWTASLNPESTGSARAATVLFQYVLLMRSSLSRLGWNWTGGGDGESESENA